MLKGYGHLYLFLNLFHQESPSYSIPCPLQRFSVVDLGGLIKNKAYPKIKRTSPIHPSIPVSPGTIAPKTTADSKNNMETRITLPEDRVHGLPSNELRT